MGGAGAIGFQLPHGLDYGVFGLRVQRLGQTGVEPLGYRAEDLRILA